MRSLRPAIPRAVAARFPAAQRPYRPTNRTFYTSLSALDRARAQNVGIHAMDVYFPRTTVNQAKLEEFNGVEKGRYTKGLGQTNMAFVGDREDSISMSLTSVQNFMEKFNIRPDQIGRLEVGTETLLDKSKSIKSYLMDLFAASGNTDMEGVDTLNACYGGTNALFNSINWVESSAWDGRYALCVATDIAVYAPGAARPTGGAGSVVMLVGPDAPIVFDQGLRASHMENVFDFYKPDADKEYAHVDGKLSISCYLRSIDVCYDNYARKFKAKTGRPFSMAHFDYNAFHAPFNGMVQKSVARLLYNDFLVNPKQPQFASVQDWLKMKREDTYFNKDLEVAFRKLADPLYQRTTVPSILLQQELGNMYTGSLYAGLMSLLHNKGDDLLNKHTMLFSYGSGMASTMFSFQVQKSVKSIVDKAQIGTRLAQRRVAEPAEFTAALERREKVYGEADWTPTDSTSDLFPGTYYLDRVDDLYRRSYKRYTPQA